MLVVFFLPNLAPTTRPQKSHWRELDYVGAFLSVAMVTLLLLPLQWGGNTRPWNDPLVIALLVAVSSLMTRSPLRTLTTTRVSFLSSSSFYGSINVERELFYRLR